jgi:hypothetical protein
LASHRFFSTEEHGDLMGKFSDKNFQAPKAGEQPSIEQASMSEADFQAAKAPPPATPAPAPRRATAPAAAEDAPPLYRVLEPKTIRVGLAVQSFEPGQILNASYYMPEVFREFLALVKMEPVKG